jgi:two-component system sensor histidine kinase KdpD
VQLAAAAQNADTQIASEKVRNVLLSSISHDFRTPLASIIGTASTLLDDAASSLGEERRRGLLSALLGEAQRLHRLVGNLLDLTRLTSGPVQLKLEWTALDELVGSVLNRLRGVLAGRDVMLDVPQGLPLARCDEVLIEQVLFNLVENAQKHTPPGTVIRIGVKAWPAMFDLYVADAGPGLPPGDEQRVFEKFHRGHAEAAQSGFGLGLTICKTIVEAHGGEIRARNLPEGGVEFRFSLPRTEAEESQA